MELALDALDIHSYRNLINASPINVAVVAIASGDRICRTMALARCRPRFMAPRICTDQLGAGTARVVIPAREKADSEGCVALNQPERIPHALSLRCQVENALEAFHVEFVCDNGRSAGHASTSARRSTLRKRLRVRLGLPGARYGLSAHPAASQHLGDAAAP